MEEILLGTSEDFKDKILAFDESFLTLGKTK